MKCSEVILGVEKVENTRLIHELVQLLEIRVNANIEVRLGRKLRDPVELRLEKASCLQHGGMFHLCTEDMEGKVYLGQFQSELDRLGESYFREAGHHEG